MTVYVFGNPDLPEDALPLRLLPRLRERFPTITFERQDPNEEWTVSDQMTVIDTVAGIDTVQVFQTLEPFITSPRLSLHDFDALAQLRLLQKLGKLHHVTIIGVPPAMPADEAFSAIVSLLTDRLLRVSSSVVAGKNL